MPAVVAPIELLLAARHLRHLWQVDGGKAVALEDTRDLEAIGAPAAGGLLGGCNQCLPRPARWTCAYSPSLASGVPAYSALRRRVGERVPQEPLEAGVKARVAVRVVVVKPQKN